MVWTSTPWPWSCARSVCGWKPWSRANPCPFWITAFYAATVCWGPRQLSSRTASRDAAFKPIEGDDKDFCKAFKKRNKDERTGQKSLFGPGGDAWHGLGDCHVVMAHVDAIEDSTPKGIREKEEQYRRCVTSEGFQHAKLVANAWCAAFVWIKKERPGLTRTHHPRTVQGIGEQSTGSARGHETGSPTPCG